MILKKINKITFQQLKVFIASLILPSLIFPVKYSSLIIILSAVITIINLFVKKAIFNKRKSIIYLFIGYFITILISFFVDLFNGVLNFDFLARNITILIMPLFIFTSSFSLKESYKVLKLNTFIISFLGVFIVLSWFFGYHKYFSQNEYQQKEWMKNQIEIENNKNDSSINFTLKSKKSKPSLRKIATLKNNKLKDTLVREFIIK